MKAGTTLTGASAPSRAIAAGSTETFDSDVVIRPQYDLDATDFSLSSTATVGGSAGPSLTLDALGVLALRFGDREVWRNGAAVPMAMTAANSLLRNLIAGHGIRGGLDITVTLRATVTNADLVAAQTTTFTTTAVVWGRKEIADYCR